ncbi:MAG: beta-galactosidase [Kiritimatiellae bacterium]|nr:beta-galactosidase [Kiritimatiellia bacterium]
MKRAAFMAAALAAATAGAWQPAPGMKTPWGEKVTPGNAWREYPRPQMVRRNWTNLNGLWQYAITKDAPACPEKWDGEILVPFVVESPLSGVGRLLAPEETLWYKRTFDAATKNGERLLLHIEQADFRAMVYVNGREVGVPHEGGQMPFSYDITDFAKNGMNELVVSVWDPTQEFIGSSGKQAAKPSGCFYTRSSGIGGTVWLETVPATHIAGYRVTPDVDAGTVRFEFDVAGGGFSRPEVDVTVEGRTVSTKDGVAVVKMQPGFKLWSPEAPALYDFTAKCGADSVSGYFGMRKTEVKKDANGVLRIFFNNKPRFLLGTLDQGWWPDGFLTPPSDEAMAFDIAMLKKMGYDMMRKHIKVEPRRYYYLCDKMGVIVMQDMPSGSGNRQQRYGFYRRELKEMIDHLYNSPSIVSWIPYNESWGQPGEFLTHATLVWTQRYDPSRIIDGPSGWNDYEGGLVNRRGVSKHKPAGVEEAADLVDRHDYARTPGMFEVNDRRASFLGEFGGVGCRVAGHLWNPKKAWGYGGTGGDTDWTFVQKKFITLMERVADLAENGLAGSVYTQTTDVENEINGLITYDRKVVKFDAAALAAVHAKVRAAAERGTVPHDTVAIFPRLDPNPKAWAWTTTEPGYGWAEPSFSDAGWARAPGGFGSATMKNDHRHAKCATEWNTSAIWLRRHFAFNADMAKILSVKVEMFHDEDAEVYLNGKLVLSAPGYNTNWTSFRIPLDKFAAAVKKGDNVLAVKVTQKIGGQYIDLGLSVDTAK